MLPAPSALARRRNRFTNQAARPSNAHDHDVNRALYNACHDLDEAQRHAPLATMTLCQCYVMTLLHDIDCELTADVYRYKPSILLYRHSFSRRQGP